MMVPILFKAVFDGAGFIPTIVDKISEYFKETPEMSYTRTIEVEVKTNAWGYTISDDQVRNNVLEKAISMYLSEQDLKFQSASVNLTCLKENSYYYSDDDNDDDEEDKDMRSEVG